MSLGVPELAGFSLSLIYLSPFGSRKGTESDTWRNETGELGFVSGSIPLGLPLRLGRTSSGVQILPGPSVQWHLSSERTDFCLLKGEGRQGHIPEGKHEPLKHSMEAVGARLHTGKALPRRVFGSYRAQHLSLLLSVLT